MSLRSDSIVVPSLRSLPVAGHSVGDCPMFCFTLSCPPCTVRHREVFFYQRLLWASQQSSWRLGTFALCPFPLFLQPSISSCHPYQDVSGLVSLCLRLLSAVVRCVRMELQCAVWSNAATSGDPCECKLHLRTDSTFHALFQPGRSAGRKTHAITGRLRGTDVSVRKLLPFFFHPCFRWCICAAPVACCRNRAGERYTRSDPHNALIQRQCIASRAVRFQHEHFCSGRVFGLRRVRRDSEMTTSQSSSDRLGVVRRHQKRFVVNAWLPCGTDCKIPHG